MTTGRPPRNVWAVLALLNLFLGQCSGQQVGVDICACQPDVYEFTINLEQTCGQMTIDQDDPGILETACVVNPSGQENVTDFVPVIVTEIQVVELDQNFDVIGNLRLNGQYTTGSKFNYTSITARPRELNATSIPAAIQLFLNGRNAAEEDLVNFYAIVYDNDCGVWPLLTAGDLAGWTIFVSVQKE